MMMMIIIIITVMQYYQSEAEDSQNFGYEDWFCGVPQITWHIQNVPTSQRLLLPPFALTHRDAGDSSFLPDSCTCIGDFMAWRPTRQLCLRQLFSEWNYKMCFLVTLFVLFYIRNFCYKGTAERTSTSTSTRYCFLLQTKISSFFKIHAVVSLRGRFYSSGVKTD
jgi:hypothetical protein